MSSGNVAINREIAKEVRNGIVYQVLPEIEYVEQMHPLFSTVSPIKCQICNNPLFGNQHYERIIITSYGNIIVPTTYWICKNPNCAKHHTDTIIGVTGSANYSDEYNEKMQSVRYNGRCTLWKSHTVGEIFTEGLTDISGRAPCPTTLWKYEQIRGKVSAQELQEQEINFNGTLYIDGYWVKTGWRKYIEAQLGRKFTDHEWKIFRHKVIYVVATEDKVILDFQITNRMPSFIELVPLMNRIKNRLPEEDILKIVSDEDDAIIGSVEMIFPKVSHSFCVFHQLQNVTKKYLDEFKEINKIPSDDLKLYGLAKDLIVAETVIESTIYYQKILEIASSIELSKASEKVISYIKKVYSQNEKLLKKGFTPETNNVMEQLFSLISDIFTQARSFKINKGLYNFCCNLFTIFNRSCFKTGEWKGFSPIDRAKIKFR